MCLQTLPNFKITSFEFILFYNRETHQADRPKWCKTPLQVLSEHKEHNCQSLACWHSKCSFSCMFSSGFSLFTYSVKLMVNWNMMKAVTRDALEHCLIQFEGSLNESGLIWFQSMFQRKKLSCCEVCLLSPYESSYFALCNQTLFVLSLPHVERGISAMNSF